MAVTKLGTLTPSSTDTTEFTSIPGTYDDLMIIGSSKNIYTSSTAFSTYKIKMRMNNDSSTNYSWGLWGNDGSYAQVQNEHTYDSVYVFGNASSHSSNVGWGHFSIYIPGYKIATAYKSFQIQGGYSTTASHQSGWTGYGQWLSNSAITEIDLVSAYLNYVSGTTITLYGISNS
tara:strand:- start:835 stop:1356 length:522 start_codon:yes stop_codon:yes gene_type:complete